MKKKRHRFVHQDPELIKTANDQQKPNKEPLKKVDDENYGFIKEDLKKSVTTIAFFVLLLIIFYLVNNKYDTLNYLKNIQL